eukprot:5347585-Prymnesium_polylepis.1
MNEREDAADAAADEAVAAPPPVLKPIPAAASAQAPIPATAKPIAAPVVPQARLMLVDDYSEDDDDENKEMSVATFEDGAPATTRAPSTGSGTATPVRCQAELCTLDKRRRRSEWEALTGQWFGRGTGGDDAYSNKRARRSVCYEEASEGCAADSIDCESGGHLAKGGYDTVKVDVTQTSDQHGPTTAIPVRAAE